MGHWLQDQISKGHLDNHCHGLRFGQGGRREAGVALTVGSNRTCSDGRCGKNKHSYDNPSTEDRVSSKELICYGC